MIQQTAYLISLYKQLISQSHGMPLVNTNTLMVFSSTEIQHSVYEKISQALKETQIGTVLIFLVSKLDIVTDFR